MRVDLVEGPAGGDPVLDVAMAHALLELVASGQRPPVVRCYRPHPTVAFGRRDRFLEGFPDAAAEARRHGFTPVIRGAGGRAAAYHQDCLIFDEVMPAGASTAGIRERFADDASRQAEALRGLAVDARVGEVPGEYCPGQFSVNARGRVKLIGAAERIVRGSWLHSSVVVVESAVPSSGSCSPTSTPHSDWTGSRRRRARWRTRRRVLAWMMCGARSSTRYAVRYELVPASLGELERARARELLDRHRVDT